MGNKLKYNGFIGSVEYSEEDEVYYGKLEGISDLVLFEGKTKELLKKNFELAVKNYTNLPY
ncbi:DNA repair protein [Joostella sp. CR20]|uniref:DNA repair protein n=1 Tax=Joostella sp. CR20 TaxID=2804312 RepID=UPI00313E63D0